MSNLGYKEQGKKRAANQKPIKGIKPGFAINPEQMDFERRKLLEEMSTKLKPNRKTLNAMAAVAATEEPEYFDEEGKESQPSAYYHSGQGYSHPVWHSWPKKD